MKNNFIFLILIILINFFLINISSANEIFNFDVTEVEIKENGNKFIGKNKGIAKTLDGTSIKADYFDYDKIKNILIAQGSVEINDVKNQVKIFSDKITYFKNDELILSEKKSKAINENFEITADNFRYNKLANIINAYGSAKIENKNEKYLIFSDSITYDKNCKNFFQKKIQKKF